MLNTPLNHLESVHAVHEVLEEYDQVMVCCGRMGPMCLPVYAVMDKLQSAYPNVHFYDQDFDGPGASFIRNLPECASFTGLPFVIYFDKGQVVAATSSLQTTEQVKMQLDRHF